MTYFLLSNSVFYIIIIVCVGLLVGFLVYYFNKKRIIIRKLSKIPNKHIGSLRTNELSKVSGKALHVHEPLIAPLSKRKCIFYSIKIQQKKSNGKSTYWKTLVEEDKFQDFFIERNGNLVI